MYGTWSWLHIRLDTREICTWYLYSYWSCTQVQVWSICTWTCTVLDTWVLVPVLVLGVWVLAAMCTWMNIQYLQHVWEIWWGGQWACTAGGRCCTNQSSLIHIRTKTSANYISKASTHTNLNPNTTLAQTVTPKPNLNLNPSQTMQRMAGTFPMTCTHFVNGTGYEYR